MLAVVCCRFAYSGLVSLCGFSSLIVSNCGDV